MTQPKNKEPATLAGSGHNQTEPRQSGVTATPQGSTMPPTSQPDFLRAALWYASRGWHVFPCRPGGKEPAVPGGCTAATADETVIRGWWEHWPDANIGIHPAPSGLVVLDVDAKNGGEGLKSWNALRERLGAEMLDNTVMANTPSGGLHIYYQTRGLQIRNATEGNSPLGDGISVRVSGYYVVAPPSRMPAGSYSWVAGRKPSDRQPAPLPEGLAALLAGGKDGAAGKNGVEQGASSVAIAHPGPPADSSHLIREGQRNTTLTSLAGSMRRRGATPEAIEAALLAENAKRCDPPLPEEEVRQIAASVGRYPPEVATAAAGVTVGGDESGDYGHAKALDTLGFGEHFRWAIHRGAWMQWTGTVWRAVSEQVAAKHASDELRRHYAALLLNVGERDAIRELTRKINEACSYTRMGRALSFLRGFPGVETRPEEWDPDPWSLNVKNGILNLREMELYPHDPAAMLTKLANVEYDQNAMGKLWEEHINRFLPNQDVRRQVQRDLGRALVGATLEESLPIWYGCGANGKTTTARALLHVMGDYADRAAPNLLVLSKHDRHPTEIADLVGLRLVFSVEVDQGRRLAEALVKELTGGDRKKGRFMRQDFFSFDQTFSIVLIVNHKPIVTGTDDGIWRRIRLIPWEYRIPDNEKRPQDDVLGELHSESSAILNWLLAGLVDWQSDRGWMAEDVRAASDAYRAEMDVLGDFIRERCVLAPRYTVPKGELYQAYVAWCEENHEKPVSARGFTSRLRDRGIGESREGHRMTRCYVGIKLAAEPGGQI